MSGDTAIVGAESTENDVDGLAYVFARSNGSWSRQATLVPDGLDPVFGRFPVAVSGDTALVGNHLYARTDGVWTRETTLAPPGDRSVEIPEMSVDIDGGTVVVGNPEHERTHGAVYVFGPSDDSWVHRTTLSPADGNRDRQFGSAVSVDGDTLVVNGDADDTANGTTAGSVYVFGRSDATWSQQATLSLDESEEDDSLRSSVSLSGDTVMIGTDRDEAPDDEHSGAAYVFERTNGEWRQQARLVPEYEGQPDWLGQYGDEIALAGDTALLSGLWSPTPQIQDGVESAFLFSSDGGSWSQTRRLDPPESGGPLGPVAIADDTALVGSPLDRGNGSEERGAVYVYRT